MHEHARTTISLPAGRLRLLAPYEVTTHQTYPYYHQEVQIFPGDHLVTAVVQLGPKGWQLGGLIAAATGIVRCTSDASGDRLGHFEVVVPRLGSAGVPSLADYLVDAAVLRRVDLSPGSDGQPRWRIELRT